jgi:hypothetical protein
MKLGKRLFLRADQWGQPLPNWNKVERLQRLVDDLWCTPITEDCADAGDGSGEMIRFRGDKVPSEKDSYCSMWLSQERELSHGRREIQCSRLSSMLFDAMSLLIELQNDETLRRPRRDNVDLARAVN